MELKREFIRFIDFHIRRILTQMDRDPDSPTVGCFDRVYWHYKARDYSSAILQQSIHALECIRKGEIEMDAPKRQLERLVKATVKGLTRQINAQGGVDEYYPRENSFVAGAFSLSAVCRVLLDWQETAPHLLEGVDFQALQRLVDHMQYRSELRSNRKPGIHRKTTPACQHAAAVAALFIASELDPLHVSRDVISSNLQMLLEGQDEEGWFNEYGGPDYGYLSVTIDALADIHRISDETIVLDALNRAVNFVAGTIGVDGKIPFELGSRNTEYFYPYGTAYAAGTNPAASWLLHTVFRDMNSPEHFLWSIDDRYMTHCTFASLVRALPYLSDLCPPEEPIAEESLWLPNSGLWFEKRRDYTLAVSAYKGGILRVARRNGPPILDHGFRVNAEKKKWTNNWWNNALDVRKNRGEIIINGSCHPVIYDLPTSLLHFGLRILAFLFRHHLKPVLKKVMILREGKGGGAGPDFERRISLEEEGYLVIEDIVRGSGELEAVPGPRQNLRYVPSANNFHPEEWVLPLGHGETVRGRERLDRRVRIRIL